MRNKLMAMNAKSRVSLLFTCFLVSGILMFVISQLWFLFFASMFFFLAFLISTNLEYDKMLRNNFDNLAKDILSKNNFTYDEFHIGDDKLTAIAINEKDEKLAIVYRKSIKDSFMLSSIQFSDVIESSIVENGESILKTSKESAVGGALIGGVIAGGIGATIGGLSANKTLNYKVKRISLMITVNDLTNPMYEVNFMNTVNPIDKDNPIYKSRYSTVYKWHKMISIILKRNELNSKTI